MQAALESVPGVRTVQVSFDEKEAYVVYDPEQATIEQMAAALDKAGFQGRFKKEGIPTSQP